MDSASFRDQLRSSPWVLWTIALGLAFGLGLGLWPAFGLAATPEQRSLGPVLYAPEGVAEISEVDGAPDGPMPRIRTGGRPQDDWTVSIRSRAKGDTGVIRLPGPMERRSEPSPTKARLDVLSLSIDAEGRVRCHGVERDAEWSGYTMGLPADGFREGHHLESRVPVTFSVQSEMDNHSVHSTLTYRQSPMGGTAWFRRWAAFVERKVRNGPRKRGPVILRMEHEADTPLSVFLEVSMAATECGAIPELAWMQSTGPDIPTPSPALVGRIEAFAKPRRVEPSDSLPSCVKAEVEGAIRIYADCAAPLESIWAVLRAVGRWGTWRYSFAVVDSSGRVFDESFGATTEGLGPRGEWLDYLWR